MPEVNNPDSMNDVVDSLGPVIKGFIDNVIRAEMPSCKYVYDPELSYESGVARLRANNQMNELEGANANQPLPLFIFRRTALMYPEEAQAPNVRSTHGKGAMRTDDGIAVQYGFAHAEFNIDFMYINPNMKEIEQFEITYLSKRGITGTTQFEVELAGLGSFMYYLTWNDVIDVEVQQEANYFKGIASTVKIRGFFFVFESRAKQILEIRNRIATFQRTVGMLKAEEVLKEDVILPP